MKRRPLVLCLHVTMKPPWLPILCLDEFLSRRMLCVGTSDQSVGRTTFVEFVRRRFFGIFEGMTISRVGR